MTAQPPDIHDIPFTQVDRIRAVMAQSPPKTEESWVFRAMVQWVVIVGIIATDVAGAGAMNLFGVLPLSVVAVPLSVVGAIWSWQRRQYPNIAAKFLIAIGMVLMMLLFFRNLLSNLNDTRLVLAQLLIELQVLHSFDLPRRKDLGYSMVIGLILLGVAGTVSQSLAFAPWLLLFFLIALPMLMLDYRSRLGLPGWDDRLFGAILGARKGRSLRQSLAFFPFSWQQIAAFVGVILLLGLGIFAIMPRFPSYQLQPMPVGVPENLTEENQTFRENNSTVVNPGYARNNKTKNPNNPGQGGGGDDNTNSQAPGLTNQGGSPEQGRGQMDSTFYYGFNNVMNQNLRGSLKKKLVMRVRSQAPGFWRVMAFDTYTGQGWKLDKPEQLETLRRPGWTYRFSLFSPATSDSQRIIQSYTVVGDLPNIIPMLSVPSELYFPTQEVQVDTEGGFRSPIGLGEGLTYTVSSDVPRRNRTLLRQASTVYPKRLRQKYLAVPPAIGDRVRQKTEELLATAPQPLTSVYEKSLYLAQTLKQRYSINGDLPFFGDQQDLVTSFLFDNEGGYPDHFSTVLTVMLRSIGIPARLVVGFGPGQYNPFTGYYLVHNTDAYAMAEVYFPKFGWLAFDPIPGHEVLPPSFDEAGEYSVLATFWKWIAGWVPSPVSALIGFLWEKSMGWLLLQINRLWIWVSGSIFGALVGLVGAILCSFLVWLGWLKMQQWLYRRALAKLHPMDKLYRQLLQRLAERGQGKTPYQTPLEFADHVYDVHPPEVAEAIADICRAYAAWRYGHQEQNLAYLESQWGHLQQYWRRLTLSVS